MALRLTCCEHPIMVDMLSSRVLGALLAVLAVYFWYEAPTWARENPRSRWPFMREKRQMQQPSPDPRAIRVRLIVLRVIAVAVFTIGVLQVVGVKVTWR